MFSIPTTPPHALLTPPPNHLVLWLKLPLGLLWLFHASRTPLVPTTVSKFEPIPPPSVTPLCFSWEFQPPSHLLCCRWKYCRVRGELQEIYGMLLQTECQDPETNMAARLSTSGWSGPEPAVLPTVPPGIPTGGVSSCFCFHLS